MRLLHMRSEARVHFVLDLADRPELLNAPPQPLELTAAAGSTQSEALRAPLCAGAASSSSKAAAYEMEQPMAPAKPDAGSSSDAA